MSKHYDVDSNTKTITIYNTKYVGELITSLHFLLKDWSDFKIIIHKKKDESKTNL
jgi:uncharacterized protein YigE (DUF2233 family)